MYGLRGLGDVCDPKAAEFDAAICNNLFVPAADTGNVCDSTSKMFDAAVCNTLYVPKTAAGGITATLNQYATPLMFAAGGLLLLMMMKGRR